MKLDFTGLSYSPKWYDFETGKPIYELSDKPALQIRPYPPELRNVIIKDGGLVVDGKQTREMFIYCLTDMAGFTDASGAPVVLSESVKEAIYKFDLQGILAFVIMRSREFADAKVTSEKN